MIIFGDCRDTMRQWAKDGIKAQTCVTSPPYYGLRDYGTAKWKGGDKNCDHVRAKVNPLKVGGFTGERLRKEGGSENEKYLSYKKLCPDCNAVRVDSQIGIEETPEEYIKAMVEVFRCVWNVLEDNGTLWLNIGDSYYNYRPGKGQALVKQSVSNTNQDLPETCARRGNKLDGLKEKDLIGIPWMLAFALRADGWYLRQDIIWHKPNPMPESVQDRCTKAHEYIFLMSKSSKYYYNIDAIREPHSQAEKDGVTKEMMQKEWIAKRESQGKVQSDQSGKTSQGGTVNRNKNYYGNPEGRNKRSVWTVTTKPYSGAHFATFPTDLIEPCIKAGCPEGGVVLDPFMGSGTTAYVAALNNRKYLGCELNPAYKPLQDERIKNAQMETAQMELI